MTRVRSEGTQLGFVFGKPNDRVRGDFDQWSRFVEFRIALLVCGGAQEFFLPGRPVGARSMKVAPPPAVGS